MTSEFPGTTHRLEVGQFGDAAVFPVLDMVRAQAAGGAAAGDRAGPVAVLEGAAESAVDSAGGSAGADGFAVALEPGLAGGIAGQIWRSASDNSGPRCRAPICCSTSRCITTVA